jgi:multiple sugar transport system substrate-binding protein
MKIKRVAGATAVVLAGTVLAACGDDDDAGSDGVRTVVVWDRAGAEATARQKFFEQWNQEEGADLGIEVQYEPQATEKYEEIVQNAFQTQRGPDVFHAPSSQMGAYVGAGWVQPLAGAVDEAVLSEAEPYLQDSSELVWGGEAYAIPSTTFTIRLGINKDLFRQAGLDPDNPPETFSEVEDAAQAITEAEGEAYGVGIPMRWVGFLNWIVDTPILSTDTDLTQEGLFNMSSGEFEADRYEPVIEHYNTLIENGWAYPGAESLDSDPLLGAFAEGKIGMYITSGSIVGSLRLLDSPIDFGVAPIPIPDGATREQSPMNAGFPYAMSSMTEDTDAAATVLETLVGDDMQTALAEAGIPPLSQAVWNSPAVQQDEWLQLFSPTDLDQQWPKKPGSVVSAEGEDATTTVSKLILDPSDLESTLDDLSERYQEAYETAVDNGEVDPEEFGG